MAPLGHAEVVLVFTFSHAAAGAGIVGAVSSENALVGVIDSVLTSQLVKFALLKLKIRTEKKLVLTIKKSKKRHEAT